MLPYYAQLAATSFRFLSGGMPKAEILRRPISFTLGPAFKPFIFLAAPLLHARTIAFSPHFSAEILLHKWMLDGFLGAIAAGLLLNSTLAEPFSDERKTASSLYTFSYMPSFIFFVSISARAGKI